MYISKLSYPFYESATIHHPSRLLKDIRKSNFIFQPSHADDVKLQAASLERNWSHGFAPLCRYPVWLAWSAPKVCFLRVTRRKVLRGMSGEKIKTELLLFFLSKMVRHKIIKKWRLSYLWSLLSVLISSISFRQYQCCGAWVEIHARFSKT